MSNVVVIPGVSPVYPKYTLIGYNTILPGSAVTGTEDSSYPIANALDYRDNTEFSPPTTGSTVFELEQTSVNQVDYCGLVSKNARDANLSVKIEIYDQEIDDYVEVANVSDIGNAKPVGVYFGQLKSQGYFDTLRQRFTFTSDSKAYVLSIYCGKAFVMPYTPAVGLQPGDLNPKDQVENFKTEGNNFTIGRRIPKGFTAIIPVNYVHYDTVRTYLPAYQQHVLNSRPVYAWYASNSPSQAIYGLQNRDTMPTGQYVLYNRANLQFEINGYS